MAKRRGRRKQATTLNEDEKEHTFAFSLLQHLVVPTFVLDTQCKVIMWNAACERLTGMPAEEVLGTENHRIAFYDQPRPCLSDLIVLGRTAEVHQLYTEHANIVGTADGLYVENWCIMTRTGARLYIAADASSIRDKAGKLVAVIETVRDITAQKEAQVTLERLAILDGLTGIANRRRFDETLQLEWSRSLRESKALTLLMIDVDHFKRYNDTYGHLAGDACLKRIAATLSDSVQRTIDLVARYGGEEFAVILPNATGEGALVVAERIRAAVERLDLSDAGVDAGHVTISIGIATGSARLSGTPEQLIEAADAALYQAKHEGRNRVVAAELAVENRGALS